MVDPTLTISIDRSGMAGSPAPIVLAGDDSQPLGITGYTEPARQARVLYAPDSPWLHGSTAVASVWQQSILAFDFTVSAATETELRTLVADLRNALAQFSYTATVTVNGAAGDVWACDMGTLVPAPRSYEDLRDFDPAYSVTIPVYPIPGA